MNQSIASDVAKGLGELGKETLEKSVEETGKIFESIISTKELLGDITPMNDEDLRKKEIEEEKKKQEEMAKLRTEMGQGRDVEAEMEQIRKEKERMEEQEEKMEEQRKIQEEQMAEEGQLIIEPETKRKGPGAGMAKGKQGKASNSDMSATAEYYKKPD